MKKVLWLGMFLLLVSLVFGENLYQYDSLELELEVEGGLNLVAEGSGAEIESVEAELGLYPGEGVRQRLLSWESSGEVDEGKVVFEWKDGELGGKGYGFKARVGTENLRREVGRKVLFPVRGVEEYEEYLGATETIDKDDPGIVAKASELAEGEDDLFRVVFKLAKWVEENIEYELNTLTAGASQKASWVLENRQGVCDEMTSLFLGMCRALGIPARFVSGISYTTSELFAESWLPHGWGEVYFPGVGWVGFDITFGEYGYVDVTHIRLREGFDPSEASTKFEWLANQVKLEAEELDFLVQVRGRGGLSEEEIELREEIVGEEVELGSYNLVKGIVENKKNYYLGTTLKLAVPEEVEIISEEKKAILLGPGESKEVFWIVKVKEGLRENYWYEFPVVVYSEKNVSAEERFKVLAGGVDYSLEEVEGLVVSDEKKSYAEEVEIECDYEEEMKLGEEKEIECRVKNLGNVNLEGVEFCVGSVCKVVDLLINQEEELRIKVRGEEVGWQKLVVRAENEEVAKRISLEYKVRDDPKVGLVIEAPAKVGYKENFEISLKVDKNSFSVPQNVSLTLRGKGQENRWEMEELTEGQEFIVEMSSQGLGKENDFGVELRWGDKEGEVFERKEIMRVEVEGGSFWEKIVIWFNGIINSLRF